MNINTGHLVTGAYLGSMINDEMRSSMVKLCREGQKATEEEILSQYQPVPDNLQKAAEIKLAGRNEAMVSLTSGGKLSMWAAQERKKLRNNKKHKRQIQKESRRKNRG